MKKLKVNENCIGCGACMSIAPDLFDYSSEGLSEVKDVEITDGLMLKAQDAIDGCPVGAIEMIEEDMAEEELEELKDAA